MSKEEIKNKHFERNEFGFLVITDRGIDKCMDEYEKQESEKKTVAFAEWNHTNVSYLSGRRLNYIAMLPNGNYQYFNNVSDLYQYWIENVYNK